MNTRDQLRSMWEGRQLPEAWELYRTLTANGTGDAEVHLLGAYIASAMGDLYAARYVCEEGLASQPTENTLGALLFRYGTILLRLGQPEMAIAQFRHILEGAYLDHLPVTSGHLFRNLGLAYRQAGRYEDALEAYDRSCSAFRTEQNSIELCKALISLAWSSCLFGDSIQSSQAIAEARPLCTEEWKWNLLMSEAFLEYVSGSPHRAVEICTSIRGDETKSVPLDVQSHAYWLIGKIELEAFGDVKAAEAAAHEAIRLGARSQNEARSLYDGADLLRKVEERRSALIEN